MSGDRTEQALARIGAALARIEAAAGTPRASQDDGEIAALRDRHAKLRAAVADSLAQLDTMLDGARG